MSRTHVFLLTFLAMIAFAGNSLLCRLALDRTGIDPASFTLVRIVSGAITLWLVATLKAGTFRVEGGWRCALCLFAYAAGFSFAYVSLTASMGALLLFGAVQATMIGYGFLKGERLNWLQSIGVLLAIGGLSVLLLPGLSALPVVGALLMLAAGDAWGGYSLFGKGVKDPTSATAGNFLRATLPAVILGVVALAWKAFDPFDVDFAGMGYAIASGAITSGLGYAVWYAAVRELKATTAATVQLSVPVIASAGGALLLGEQITPRLIGCSIAILGGIALVIFTKNKGELRQSEKEQATINK